MSHKARAWAMKWTTTKPLEKWLLVTIADLYNDVELRAWPSQSRLARDTCMGLRTVNRHIRSLEALGLIEVEEWFNAGNNSRTSNRYYLPLYDERSRRIGATGEVVHATFDKKGNWSIDEAA